MSEQLNNERPNNERPNNERPHYVYVTRGSSNLLYQVKCSASLNTDHSKLLFDYVTFTGMGDEAEKAAKKFYNELSWISGQDYVVPSSHLHTLFAEFLVKLIKGKYLSVSDAAAAKDLLIDITDDTLKSTNVQHKYRLTMSKFIVVV